jgi:hypothetical protein
MNTNKQEDKMNRYKVKSAIYNDQQEIHSHAEFTVTANDMAWAKKQADQYMLENYGQEAYDIDTDIVEIK